MTIMLGPCSSIFPCTWSHSQIFRRLGLDPVIQATEGDVKGSQPWAVNLEARAKWDAWNSIKGMSKEEAMQLYIELMEDPDVWENHEALKDYPGPQWM